MRILVAVASRHGSTMEMGQAIGGRLGDAGHAIVVAAVTTAGDLSEYDAFVIGSATYRGHWMRDATSFVREHVGILAERPTWLFSSGPLVDETDDQRRGDQLIAAEPSEVAGLAALVHARGHRVFFGELDPNRLGIRERALRALPFVGARLAEGDFRDLGDLEGWADRIAHELAWGPDAIRETRPGVELP